MFFCYILSSLNQKYLYDTYIGFTNDPLHRFRQHNGEIKGGARYTKKRRPWLLVAVVSNFPNKIAALKFEWAWQNPFSSNFIKNDIESKIEIPKLKRRKMQQYYNSIIFKIQILNILINSKVFDRINLNIYIFNEKPSDDIYISDYLISNIAKIFTGVNSENFIKLLEKNNENNAKENANKMDIDNDELLSIIGFNIPDKCLICEELFISSQQEKKKSKEKNNIFSQSSDGVQFDSDNENEINNFNKNINENDNKNEEKIVVCKNCKSPFHMICLAKYELERNNDYLNLIPKNVECFVCGKNDIWSEWVKNLTEQNKTKLNK